MEGTRLGGEPDQRSWEAGYVAALTDLRRHDAEHGTMAALEWLAARLQFPVIAARAAWKQRQSDVPA